MSSVSCRLAVDVKADEWAADLEVVRNEDRQGSLESLEEIVETV